MPVRGSETVLAYQAISRATPGGFMVESPVTPARPAHPSSESVTGQVHLGRAKLNSADGARFYESEAFVPPLRADIGEKVARAPELDAMGDESRQDSLIALFEEARFVSAQVMGVRELAQLKLNGVDARAADVMGRLKALSTSQELLIRQMDQANGAPIASMVEKLQALYKRHTDSLTKYETLMGAALLKAAREWQGGIWSLKQVNSANNAELFAMNAIRFGHVIGTEFTKADLDPDSTEGHNFTKLFTAKHPAYLRAIDAASEYIACIPVDKWDEPFQQFNDLWFKSAFARLEVGHKLAASLCLTDVPDDFPVEAPWEAWSLVIPDGLLQPIAGNVYARVWCLGTHPMFAVTRDGRLYPVGDPTGELNDFDRELLRVHGAIKNLVRGACLALSNPQDFTKERSKSSGSSSKKHRSGPPELEQARFLLSAPVQIDCREHLTEYLRGTKKGASPKVQFLVRGHWANQPYGPKSSLRKRIWRQPFWKGPEESRVLLRQHKVGQDD